MSSMSSSSASRISDRLVAGNLEKCLIFYLAFIGIAIIGQNIMFEFVLDQASGSIVIGTANSANNANSVNVNDNGTGNNNAYIRNDPSSPQEANTNADTNTDINTETNSNPSNSNSNPNSNININTNYQSTSDLNTYTSLSEILEQAGVEATPEIIEKLPPIEHVVNMYGSKPVIVGLERCETFRKEIGNVNAFIGPAGMFNTGTNLLTDLLQKNCHFPEKEKQLGKGKNGMRGQTPWGKHSPVTWRHRHTASDQVQVNQTAFFPATIIKDPYTWMDSMCRHKYSANWPHIEGHCPNLVPTNEEESKQANGESTFKVNIHYSAQNKTHHESLAGIWNDWYGDWLAADFPRLMIRFEDLLFHTKEVVKQVCECGGAELKEGKFQYNQGNAKQGRGAVHKGSNGFVDSVTKYGDETKRVAKYMKEDLVYAHETLRRDMMQLFQYSDPLKASEVS